MTNLQDSKKMYDLAEKIALDDFERLEGHHEFSDTYKHKKKLFLEEIKAKSEQPKAKPKKRRLLIAVASILIAIPTTALGAVKAYEMIVQKQNYEVDISVTNTDKNSEDKFASENNENKWYKLQLNYLPENMEEVPNTDGLKFSYKDNFAKGGFSFALMRIERDSDFQALYASDYKEKEINGRKTVIINRDTTKEVYILFEKEGIMIDCFVMSDVNEDVMMKVLENISLVPTTEEDASPIAYINHENNISEENKVIPLNKDSDRIFNIGEGVPVTIESLVKGSNGTTDKLDSLEYTVEKVEVYDSIKNFDQEAFNETGLNFLNNYGAMDQENNLVPYKRNVYKLGNGKETVDELVDSQSMNVKFVYLTTTVTNTSKHETEEIYMHPSLQVLKSEGNSWIYNSNAEISEGTIMSGEVDYLEPHGSGKSYYNIGTMQPGETKKISLGYFVDEDKLDSIFLDAFHYSGYGPGKTEDLNAEDRWWIDLRQ